MKVRQALLGGSSGQLARIATAWGLHLEAGTLRRELAELLATHLLALAQDAAFWSALDEPARRVLAMLVRAGGRHEADLLVRRLRESGGASDDESAREVQAAIASLIERGLLARIFESDEQRQGVYLVLPEDILDAAREHLAESAVTSSPPPANPPESIASGDLAGDLFVLASALRREAWSAPSRGLAGRPARSVGQILGRLRALPNDGPGQPGQRWRFLLWVAQRAGWISRDPWPRPDEDAVERLLGSPGDLPGKALSAGPVRSAPPAGRLSATEQASPRRIQADTLQLLSELPPVAWWGADQVAAWIAAELDAQEDAAGSRLARPGQLQRTIGRWLAGRWFWLGLVAWGRDADGWSVIRPTPALRALTTGRPPTGDLPLPAPCSLGDGPVLVAPAGADLAALYRAEPYLAYAGVTAAGRRYQLTPPSVERGLRLGGSTDELLGLLERLTQHPVPDVWRAAIEQWGSGEDGLHLRAQLILSGDRDDALTEAKAVAAAREAIVEELTPRHAVVAGDRVAELLTGLAAAGLPVQVDPGLRAEPALPGRAAALAGSAAESAWIALEIARRLAPDVVGGQRDLTAARLQLEAVLPAGRLEALGRRVASIVAAIADRKPPRSPGPSRPRRRVV